MMIFRPSLVISKRLGLAVSSSAARSFSKAEQVCAVYGENEFASSKRELTG